MKVLTEKRREDMMIQGYRDLLAAGWLGEQMFAQLGLHRAVSVIDDPGERTRIIAESWKSERPFNVALGLALAGASVAGLIREVDRQNSLDVAASGCALGAVGCGVGCMVAGKVIGRAMPDHQTPIRTGFTPEEGTPRNARVAQRVLNVLAPVGMVLGLASIGLSIAARVYD